MPLPTLYLWKQAPFLRLLIPLIGGIVLQWYADAPPLPAWLLLAAGIIGLVVFNSRFSFLLYRFGWVNGIWVNIAFTALGMMISRNAQMQHHANWFNHSYHHEHLVTVTLDEPLSEKNKSYKANASVQMLRQGDSAWSVYGNIILYFSKDSAVAELGYGSRLVINKPLQPVKNSGNPGSFDYERYAAFHGISHQVYLRPEDYTVLPGNNGQVLAKFLYAARDRLLAIISTRIPGKKEAGMAEALLVGYKDDLDKTLVQSYSNTGVVHVIAISGMHLGLIYWLLSLVAAPLKKRKHTRWIAPVAIITGLWLFALLTGGSPSIMRSAVMFTCIVIGESIERKTFIYNSLAGSAFILLCTNPFWLWDAGFQLSYTAVLSIVIFMKPIYSWCYFSNTFMDGIWKLTAVTMAAQVLTTPISMYHFHQFPVYFLFTNLLAVPLSSLIVLLEIALCVVAPIGVLAKATGVLLHWLIAFMNGFIEYMEELPFSLWTGMQLNLPQVIFLYGFIAAIACWLLWKYKPAFITGLFCLLGVFALRSYSFIMAGQQEQLVVYNVSKHQAIDFISGRHYFFRGDDQLPEDIRLVNAALLPSRILYRANATDSLSQLACSYPVFLFHNKTIVLADNSSHQPAGKEKLYADLIIVSKNMRGRLQDLMQVFNCNQLVLDASNSALKVHKWKAEAAKLGLHCFSVVDNGAFVMKMD